MRKCSPAPQHLVFSRKPNKGTHEAKDTGKGYREGSVTGRTQSKNPKTDDYTKRNKTPGDPKRGEFMDVKKDGKPFKGVAKEPDKRRK